ncbi:MAG: O-antigen ligase family protein [Candidatus Rokubacteria bacterium]|nr:O-antigen ligase family protein [Candidatus Rokubacteria bacterium]
MGRWSSTEAGRPGGPGPDAGGRDRARHGSLATLALAAVVGLAACGVALFLAQLPLRRAVAAIAVMAICIFAAVSRRPRQALLFCWVVSLTYNRNYFFESVEVLRESGSYGPYWNPSDIFLAALLALWAYERIARKRAALPLGPAVWPWLAPFVAACLLSVLGARRMDWGAFEMLRVARIVLILWYVRFNVRAAEWWACVAGFAAAVLIQATMGITYVATGTRPGLAALLGVEDGAELRALLEGVTPEGYRRAEGTFGHPNTMALYLLLVGPLFLALGAAPLGRRARAACAVTGLVALVGIAVTLSRTSWTLVLVQAVVLAIGLAALRVVRVERALGVLCVGLFLGTLVLLPLARPIETRLTEDLREMLEFRAKHDRIALEIWQSAPLMGVGLNNYSDVLARRGEPEVDVFLLIGEHVRTVLDLRVTAWVHNIYLLLLAETGAVGLLAFLLFLVGVTVMGVRALRAPGPVWAAAGLGLFVGTLAVHVHGLQEAALWIDPDTYSFALVVGLLNAIPSLAQQDAGAPDGRQGVPWPRGGGEAGDRLL